jgi:hypothetical protein
MALGSVTRDNKVTWLILSDSFADTLNDCRSFVAENAWELSLRVTSVKGIHISVAERVRNDFDSDFLALGRRDQYLDCLKWLTGLKGHRGLALDRLSY